MGSSNGKHIAERDSNRRRRTSFRRILHISSRPLSFAGVNPIYEPQHEITARPMSMIDVGPLDHFEFETTIETVTINPMAREQFSTDIETTDFESNADTNNNNKFDEYDWQSYVPITLDKIRSSSFLKDYVYERVNHEFIYVLNRFLRIEKTSEHQGFLNWFFNEVEYSIHSFDNDNLFCHKTLLLRSIEQDRFDCTKYLLENKLFLNKIDINSINEQGRHCLLMLSHKNGPIDLIEHLLTHHLSCLDTNKIDFNKYSSLHHACRHFNLSLCELLLPYTNKKTLQIENSELHTPLDYWLECLCSLKKLKPTHIQHDIETLRLDFLLNTKDFYANSYFLQAIINRGGQLTKLPLRYIRSVLPQLTFEQKLAYVDHHVHLCCIIYKNRLSTLIHDYDELKISIQASEILTEFIYALGTIQVEIQNRLAENACSTKEQTLKLAEHEQLQSTMRKLYGKFFRLFECIYNNPDINVKTFHFEHIFRRVWIYWKDPVNIFIKQTREKNLSLKSICRTNLFRHLIHYPGDIQNLSINSFLKQFLSFDNQFFIIQRKNIF